jgi:hypothetical protein
MNKTGKIVTIFLWVLLVVSAILIVSLIANINAEVDADPAMNRWVDINLIWAYILVALCAAVAIIAGLFHTVTDKKAAKGGIVSLVFLGAVALIAYVIASPEIPQFIGVNKFIEEGLTEGIVKLIDTALFATYILLGIAILAIVASPLTRLFK